MKKQGKTKEKLTAELEALQGRVKELQEAEQAWRRREEYLRSLIENISDIIMVIDSNMTITYLSPSIERTLGYKPDFYVGKNSIEFIHPDDLPGLIDTGTKLFQNPGITLLAELRVQHCDGSWHFFQALAKSILDESGNPVIIYTSRDITERKQAEDKLRKAYDELERKVEERTAELAQANALLEQEISQRQEAEAVFRKSEERYRLLAENATDFIFILDKDLRHTYASPSVTPLLGYTVEEMMTLPLEKLFTPASLALVREDVAKGMTTERGDEKGLYRVRTNEVELIRKDGSTVWAEARVTSLRDPEGRFAGIQGIVRDITERKEAERKLQETNKKLATWVNELEERNREMVQLSEMGELLQSCQSIEETHPVTTQFAQRLFPGEQGALYLINASQDLVEAVASWGESQSSERVFMPSDCWSLRRGRLHLVSEPRSGLICRHITNPQEANYLCVPLLAQGESLVVLYLQCGLNEPGAGKCFNEHKQQLAAAVADRVAIALANLKLRETLRQQAIRDLLTGLFNRRYMEESLERELRRAERGETSVGVIMFDIDHFKNFNDLFGHDGGDAMLRELGAYLKTHIRGGDIVCRYGGEEFVLVLPDATLEDTRKRAEELREAVKELKVYHLGKPLERITLSFGVSCYPEHGLTVEEVLKSADVALYRAKIEGRDRVIIASPRR